MRSVRKNASLQDERSTQTKSGEIQPARTQIRSTGDCNSVQNHENASFFPSCLGCTDTHQRDWVAWLPLKSRSFNRHSIFTLQMR